MSEVRLNIVDSSIAVNGKVHGSVADAVIAALSAEPETISELEDALERFIRPTDDRRPFSSFHPGANQRPWDAGIAIVDLAARIVAVESSYSAPQASGEVEYHDGSKATDVWLYYRVPDDWLFLFSVDEYNARCDERRRCREKPPLDARAVLYGDALTEFLVKGCLAARDEKDQDPIARIHEAWLITTRADLDGQSPRDVMLAKREFIGFDLHTRQLQWSTLGEGPPPLARSSFAYLFAGFGTHEVVVYYDLLRFLLGECWGRVQAEEIETGAEMARLERLKTSWLAEAQEDLDGRIPSAIIESERRRIPLVTSAKDLMLDENCDLCRMLANETLDGMGPTFWFLDGCHMDEGFAFSFYRTREEWEEEERRRIEFDEEFNREWAARGNQLSDDDGPAAGGLSVDEGG
jgi:hypothetical protein